MFMYGHCTAISKYNLELKEGCFGTKGTITRQKFNFTGQHRHFKDNSRVSRTTYEILDFTGWIWTLLLYSRKSSKLVDILEPKCWALFSEKLPGEELVKTRVAGEVPLRFVEVICNRQSFSNLCFIFTTSLTQQYNCDDVYM